MPGEGGKPAGAPNQLDLNTLVGKGDLEVSIKPPESEPDGRARRSREFATFLFALALVAVVFFACLAVLLFGHASTDEQRWLQSALTLILGAAVGAAFRK